MIWIHHEGKGDGMGPRGHTTLPDACAVWWEVQEREDGSRTVFVTKANHGRCYAHLPAFKLVPFEAGRDIRDKAIELCAVELTDLKAALASKVRQRYGAQPAADPEAKLGSRQKLLLHLLNKLLAKYPAGVPRDILRSHFIQKLNTDRQDKGDDPLSPERGAAAFRQTLARLDGHLEDADGLLRPAH